MTKGPMVGIIVVNHNGGDLTIRCLRSLAATEWPSDQLRIVVVDNASTDKVVEEVRAHLDFVTVIETGGNPGFGAACNAGIRALNRADYIALVNNDASVDPGWLAPLVTVLASDATIGAAVPKILFEGRYLDVFVDSEVGRRGRGDRRDLGVRLTGVRVDGKDAWGDAQLVSGFWGIEHDAQNGSPFQWTKGSAHLRVPVRDDGSLPACGLELSADGNRTVTARSGRNRAEHRVGPAPAWFDLALDGDPFDVINSVGTVLLDDGHGADRGYLEPDDGRYDDGGEVFGWCGAGVLLARSYLDDVGTFEERFFLYYEDLDLSWRGRARGWRYVFVPSSRLRHVHSASTVEGSRLFDHYVERNRLLTLVRNAPAPLAWNAATRHVLITASYFRRDVVAPLARGAQPSLETVQRRLRSFLAFARLLPVTFLQRRRLRGAAR